MTKYNGYQSKRALVRNILILISLIIPFIRINGHSLLRFDISELILYFFGLVIPINNLFFLLLVTLFITFLFFFITVVYGRIWCGWLCPQTITMDITSFLDKKRDTSGKKPLYLLISMLISIIISMDMVFYFVDPYSFFKSFFMNGYIHPITLGFIITLTITIFLNIILVRYRFCATVCPYSMLQSLLFDSNTLAVYMIPETKDRCIKCNACVSVCPTNIDIRKGLNSACINCARCIDACAKVMSPRGEKSLLAYLFGPDNEKNLKRSSALIGLSATVIFFVACIAYALMIKPYEIELITNSKFYPRFVNAHAINGFQLIMENHSTREKTFTLKISEQSDNLKAIIEPSTIFSVKANEKRTENIFIKIPSDIASKYQLIDLHVKIEDEKGDMMTQNITFRKPFARKNGVKK
jgi:cytochrome c oxidase accessory protein FixG